MFNAAVAAMFQLLLSRDCPLPMGDTSQVYLRRYEKPCDVSKRKVRLFTIKPLFLHVSLSGVFSVLEIRLSLSMFLIQSALLQFEVSRCDMTLE
jgi:hypothetical protein